MVKKINLYLTPLQIKKYKEKYELRVTPNAFSRPNKNYSISVNDSDYKGITQVAQGVLGEYIIRTKEFQGGFILPLIAGAAAVSTIGKNIYDCIQNKKVNNELLNQKINQNKIISDHSNKGLPINVSQITADEFVKTFKGEGVSSKPSKLDKVITQFNKLSIKDKKKFSSIMNGGAITLSGKNVSR